MNTNQFEIESPFAATLPAPAEISESDLENVSGGVSPIVPIAAAFVGILALGTAIMKSVNEADERERAALDKQAAAQ